VKKNKNWPQKARELQTAIFDSTRWNSFNYRRDDIVIVTWGKSGTTWMQQIVGQLVRGAPETLDAVGVSPWLDLRIFPLDEVLGQLEAQTHRRFIKTHLPLDALVFSPEAKYIYVGRDARDVVWSAYNHQASFTDGVLDAFNNMPGRVGPPVAHPPGDAREYYLHFLDTGYFPSFPLSGFWEHVQGWWDVRELPNVLFVHFNDLKTNMRREIGRVAEFLGIEVDAAKWPVIEKHCGFDFMRSAAAKVDELHKVFNGGGSAFIHKGTNGRWKDVLTAQEATRCDEVAARRLSQDCARWLKTGERPS